MFMWEKFEVFIYIHIIFNYEFDKEVDGFYNLESSNRCNSDMMWMQHFL